MLHSEVMNLIDSSKNLFADFKNPPSAPTFLDCDPPNSSQPTKKTQMQAQQVEMPFHLSSNLFSNQASSIHDEF
jgi:hypothetical protein